MKIIPKIEMNSNIHFSSLGFGSTFLWQNGIWIKLSDPELGAVNLKTGDYQCGSLIGQIVPVETTVSWNRKETKKVSLDFEAGMKAAIDAGKCGPFLGWKCLLENNFYNHISSCISEINFKEKTITVCLTPNKFKG